MGWSCCANKAGDALVTTVVIILLIVLILLFDRPIYKETFMKKILLAALTAICCIATSTASAGEDSMLRFSWWGGSERHEATLKVLEMFEKETPGISVKAEYMGWNGYLERLTTQIGSGSEPDVMQMDWAWLATFSRNGDGFYDLLTLGDAVNTKAYEKKWLDTCMVKGKLNALPVSFTTRYFVWNKSIWDRAGVPLPKTWDELIAAGTVFKEKLGDEYYPLDTDHNTVTHMLASYIFQKTGKMIIDPETHELGLNRDELREYFAFYKRLLDNHCITSLSYRSARCGDATAQTHEQADFIDGKWAGAFYWDSNLALLLSTPKKEFTLALGDFPTQPDAKNSGRVGRPAQVFAVSKKSKNPREAAALISFLLTSPEAAKVLKMTRGIFLADSSFNALKENNLIAPMNLEAMEQLQDVAVYNPSPYFEDPRMMELINSLVEKVSYEKITPDEAAEALERDIPRLLRRLTR